MDVSMTVNGSSRTDSVEPRLLLVHYLREVAGLTGTFRPSGIAVSGSGRLYVDTDGVNGGTNRPAIAGITTAGHVQVLAMAPGRSS